MEYGHQHQKDPDMDTFSRLKLRAEFLTSKLKAAVQDNPTGEVDLYPTLEQCTTLRKDFKEYNKTRGLHSPTALYPMISSPWELVFHVGDYFGQLQHLMNPQQLAWDIRVASLFREHLRVHKLNVKDYSRRTPAEVHPLGYRLESLIYYLSLSWSPNTDLALILTNKLTMESYHVLSLHANWNGELSTANALEGPAGDIYIRSASYVHNRISIVGLPVFVMYQQGSTSLTSTSAIFPETTEESNAVGLQVTQHEERLEDFLHTALGSSTSGYSVALMLTGGFTDNEVPSLHPFMQDRPPHTGTDSSARRLPLTSQHEAVVVEPTEALQSSNTTIDMYSFMHFTLPFTPMNTFPEGLLPHENRALAASALMTSPEADSPWSETQGPPPPYALSPGIYQLRLEAATRPSTVASSPDPETPAPPYALSPGVFHRYGDDF